MPKSSEQQYQEFQEYTNYIDTSDVMLDFYKNEEGNGLEKYYLMIEEWLNMVPDSPQENHPLVIEGDGGIGKKTLLVKWHEYHQSIKPKNRRDLTILHFATTGGNNSNYFYAIYRILIKLREELNIGQKVELHEEKIRKYFAYWLDVCNQRIENQSFQNVDTVYEKIILVFEGIDYFLDRNSGKEGNIAFWLPQYFPNNVKVIVTADGESESMRYFNKLNCQKVLIPADLPGLTRTVKKWEMEKQLYIGGDIKNKLIEVLNQNLRKTQTTNIYVKSYLSCLLPERAAEKDLELKEESIKFLQKTVESIDLAALRLISDIEGLFNFLLEFWGKSLLKNEEKFKELIGILISTQKGLTKSEILIITDISQEELKLFMTLFRSFLMNFKDLWMIKNDSFKKAINHKYQFVLSELSEKIADSLKRTPNSVRKLEEETFQLYSAGNYFRLKEVISDIENFLLLFNPYTKYDLCKYWQKLEEKSFDPVIEYNKAIQGFEMHYHPTSDDLFRIITQISRFLKEFSDFQTYYTPQFRHPKIIGNKSELDDIGIMGEFKNLGICAGVEEQEDDKADEEKQQMEDADNENSQENEEQKKLKKKVKEMYEKIEAGKHIKKINKIELQPKADVANSTISKKADKKKKEKQTTVQQLNVEVKSNQQNFRKHYYQEVKPFLEKFSLGSDREISHEPQDKDDDYEDSDKEEVETANLAAKIKNMEKEKEKEKSKFQELPNLKTLYAKTVEEEFELNQKPPTNYYYKRWIWMQFPWVCMTMKCDYSDKLRKCFTSPTSYMPVSEEREFTLQALKIALEAKRKKQAILQKSEDSKPRKKESLGPVTTSSRYQNKDGASSKAEDTILTSKTKSRKKLDEIAFATNSFLSLTNLEKEMESINLHSGSSKNLARSKDESAQNTVFITAENQTYDEYSSLLHSMNKKRKKQIFTENDLNMTAKSRQEGLLPRIKQNVNKEMMGELDELEKNNGVMRREVDNYLYKNKVLAKRLKQLKIIQQNNNNQAKNEKKIVETKKKIEQIEAKIEKVKYQYAYSLLEHERLNVLIKICQQNKTQNEECIPDLVFECNNLKKMINLEKATIEDLNKKIEEIKKLTKKFLQNCFEKVKNEAILNEEIHQTLKNREYFQEEVGKYDELILDEIEEKRRNLNERAKSIHEKNEESRMVEKYRRSNYPEEEEDYQLIYEQIMEHLDLKDDNYQNDPKYHSLLDGLSKKKELEAIIQERNMELEELNKQLLEEKRDLDTLARAEEDTRERLKKQEELDAKFENEMEQLESEEALQKKLHEKQRTMKKVMDVKLSCLGMLNTWYAKLGLPEQSELTLTPEFLEKLNEANSIYSE